MLFHVRIEWSRSTTVKGDWFSYENEKAKSSITSAFARAACRTEGTTSLLRRRRPRTSEPGARHSRVGALAANMSAPVRAVFARRPPPLARTGERNFAPLGGERTPSAPRPPTRRRRRRAASHVPIDWLLWRSCVESHAHARSPADLGFPSPAMATPAVRRRGGAPGFAAQVQDHGGQPQELH